MPRVEVKSVCRCGKSKPSRDKYCEGCAKTAPTEEWAVHHNRVRQKYGYNPYHTPQWRRCRNYVIARDNGLCQHCLADGRITPFDDVDHIKSHFRGGKFFDMDNLQCLCRMCHDKKTRREIHE